ncbi:MAG: hypothetical protein K0S61_4931 [Anaerocolumna sp.]|jgi:hypothetical protein|nr:hypothetical protein [Anaerocolumna sp.]
MKNISGIIDGTAIAYFLSYKCLISKHLEDVNVIGGPFSPYFVPAITNAAFSCELALKNIIQNEYGKSARGHDLEKLFNQLSLERRLDIVGRTAKLYNSKSEALYVSDKITSEKFYVLLKAHKDSFTLWRYFYESSPNMDLDFLEAFMFCLNEVEEGYIDFIMSQMKWKDIRNYL